MPDLPAELLTKLISQAPELLVLLLLFYRIDKRMQACFDAMHAAMDKLLGAVLDDENSNSK